MQLNIILMDGEESLAIDVDEADETKELVASKGGSRTFVPVHSSKTTEHYSWSCLWDEIK